MFERSVHLQVQLAGLFPNQNDTKYPTHGKKKLIYVPSEHLVDIL